MMLANVSLGKVQKPARLGVDPSESSTGKSTATEANTTPKDYNKSDNSIIGSSSSNLSSASIRVLPDMAFGNGNPMDIDEDLHSRQLSAYGRETMRRLFASNVLVSGMQGLSLLGWMHRKFRANEPLKDFSVGKPSLDDQQYYPKSNFGTKSLGKAQRDNHLQKSLFSLEAARVEADDFEEESSVAISKLFHGFLTIGTLGSDPVITDPSTPTFATSVENITEKETEVTENELKLINDELEKVIGAEGDGCNDSSGRNSHVSTGRNSYVSTGRSSHGSTITLSEKPLEGTETNGNGTTICPLQGYLFGSAIELPETTTVVKQEHRTSLGELFQRTKIAEENYVAKSERGEKRTENETDKSVIHLMKKMLKKRMVHGSSRSCTTSTGGNVDSASSETKLHKGYLFVSAIELPETTTVVKKEHRISLGELFQRTKIAEENYVDKSERGEKRTEKETDKSAIHLMKKMLKKRMVHGSSRSCTTSTGGNVDSASSETKLQKDALASPGYVLSDWFPNSTNYCIQILHMFHRKVHPESSTATKISRYFLREPSQERALDSSRATPTHPKSHSVEAIQMRTGNSGSKQMQAVTKNLKDIQGPALAIVLERLKHSGTFQGVLFSCFGDGLLAAPPLSCS
ncbi:hypothetical protein TEA_024969 [Camellia sinensis var. sinensis]|uniref:Uncharacterized protein n=1 Tax=Camellia sinensis var. sinensis TaxID=542762 RepID=A0A4S4ES97_CAMSN|nr:hypothetical protein TEA_024969 [Camellia sinensis var. sinensis]